MHLFPHANFDVVAVAASAGGGPALERLLGVLPADFPAPIIVAQHMPRHSLLPGLLARRTGARIAWATPSCRPRPGMVLLVPPGVSVSVDRQLRCRCERTTGPLFVAPDRLFGSVAAACGRRAMGVVLTGAGSAGARGAVAIRRAGGVVIAQDAATSALFSMPAATIAAGAATLVLPLEAIARAMVALATVPGGRDLFGIGGSESRRRTA